MRLAPVLAVVLAASLLAVGGVAYYFLAPGHDGRVNPPAPFDDSALAGWADDSGWTQKNIVELGNSTSLFALEMLAELGAGGGNVLFSPYSLEAAFGMLYEGARGKTADEIRSVFHFTKDDNARWSSFAALYNRYCYGDQDYKIDTANAVWIQAGFAVLTQYLEVLTDHYKAKSASLDFTGAAEAARKTINTWVANRTEGRIAELFPPGSIDSGMLLALTNAIYFKGEWATKFDSKKTKTADFHLETGGTVQVRMMHLPEGDTKFDYAREDVVDVLRLPYKGDRLSMLVLLPRAGDTKALENVLSPASLARWRSDLEPHGLDIKIPRFEMRCSYDLEKPLSEMGMPSAFGNADFSGIDGSHDLFVQTAVHQAWISVNEEGTEAAAATGVGMTMSVPPTFVADHPFIFLIQDDETGNILFMGKVVDPTK